MTISLRFIIAAGLILFISRYATGNFFLKKYLIYIYVYIYTYVYVCVYDISHV